MSLIPVFHAVVTDDGLRLEFEPAEKRLRAQWLLTLSGQAVDVVVRKHRRQRSDRQNRWWWGIAVPLIAADLGYDRHEHEQVHYALVAKCFGTHADAKLGVEVPNVRSSTLTTTEFSELMEWAVRWAATERGIVLPLPDDAEAAA